MKKIIQLCCIVLILSGCTSRSLDLPLHQPLDNVSKIELLIIGANHEQELYTLPKTEIAVFWEEMIKIPARRYYNDPPTEYGPYAIKVYYVDGYIDIIGMNINQYIDPQGKAVSAGGWYYIANEEAFAELLMSYIFKTG